MKKYLLMGGMALVSTVLMTTGCSREDFSGSVVEAKLEAFEETFKKAYGDIDPNQNWGFATGPSTDTLGLTRGNTGDDYPPTSTGINANANEWADPTPGKRFGGWVVPAPLTNEQKAVVTAYFQAVPNLTYEDPQLRHFFVQQVYTGHTAAPETGNKEVTKSASGTEYTSANMNLLTVGYNEQHINNFNEGSYSAKGNNTIEGGVNDDGTVNVLDKGYTANDFADHHHPDQIMLMVNIDDTQCMGYHNTGSSVQRNDKAALVDWTVIRDWANQHNLDGNCLDDGWDRSFVGFDFELLSKQQSYLYDENSNHVYAQFTDGQLSGLQYVWNGEEVLTKGTKPTGSSQITGDKDITSKLDGAYLWNPNEDSFQKEGNNYVLQVKSSWRGIGVGIDPAEDWSAYQKLVVEFAEGAGTDGIFYFKNNNNDVNGTFEQGATKIEFDFSGKTYNYVTEMGLYSTSSAGTFKVSKIYLVGGSGSSSNVNYYESDYLLVNGQKVPFLITNTNMYGGEKIELNSDDSDMKIEKDGKQCFNMAKIAQLVNDGYLPVYNTNLRTWVKWQGGDGYFSDWIVTLTKANRIPTTTTEDSEDEEYIKEYNVLTESGRVFCEDLGQVSNRDMDYNDVVFDAWIYVNKVWKRTKTTTTVNGTTQVTYSNEEYVRDQPSQTKIKLWAAGGTLPLTVAGEEVHRKFGLSSTGIMINTYTSASSMSSSSCQTGLPPVEFTATTAYSHIIDIPIVVRYSNSQILELQADKGDAPHKFCAPIGTPWSAERVEISQSFPDFDKWVADRSQTPWNNQVTQNLYIDNDNGSQQAETVTLFSATPTTAWQVPAGTTEASVSSYATLTGGSMYVTNGQSAAKDLIKTQRNEMAFAFTNNDTFFKVELNSALQAGDVISVRMETRTDTDLGLWFQSTSSRGREQPTAKIVLPQASSPAWVEAPSYTVAQGDEICGMSAFYIYRHTGKSTYFNTLTITRQNQ